MPYRLLKCIHWVDICIFVQSYAFLSVKEGRRTTLGCAGDERKKLKQVQEVTQQVRDPV